MSFLFQILQYHVTAYGISPSSETQLTKFHNNQTTSPYPLLHFYYVMLQLEFVVPLKLNKNKSYYFTLQYIYIELGIYHQPPLCISLSLNSRFSWSPGSFSWNPTFIFHSSLVWLAKQQFPNTSILQVSIIALNK